MDKHSVVVQIASFGKRCMTGSEACFQLVIDDRMLLTIIAKLVVANLQLMK